LLDVEHMAVTDVETVAGEGLEGRIERVAAIRCIKGLSHSRQGAETG
jgi:hypothetical protein